MKPTEIEMQIKAKLQGVKAPFASKDLMELKQLKSIQISEDQITIKIELGYPARSYLPSFTQEIKKALEGFGTIKVDAVIAIEPHRVQGGMRGLDNVKNIIAVASGKGGVGKSTTAVNLALALAFEGARVGILDADIYGPNQPVMLGISGTPEQMDNKIKPLINHGVQSMSIGYLLPEQDTPMIWRGPMVSTALQQLLRDTLWDALDYLIIDLPPGTGDIQLTMSQKIPVSGALIVTTPQDVALMDARKAYKMFEKVNIHTLGIIENMSTYVCSHCGHEEAIFGTGGAKRIADEYRLNMLGQIPLAASIRKHADSGQPSVAAEPQSDIAKRYAEIAVKAAAILAEQGLDQGKRFPRIVVE